MMLFFGGPWFSQDFTVNVTQNFDKWSLISKLIQNCYLFIYLIMYMTYFVNRL